MGSALRFFIAAFLLIHVGAARAAVTPDLPRPEPDFVRCFLDVTRKLPNWPVYTPAQRKEIAQVRMMLNRVRVRMRTYDQGDAIREDARSNKEAAEADGNSLRIMRENLLRVLLRIPMVPVEKFAGRDKEGNEVFREVRTNHDSIEEGLKDQDIAILHEGRVIFVRFPEFGPVITKEGGTPVYRAGAGRAMVKTDDHVVMVDVDTGRLLNLEIGIFYGAQLVPRRSPLPRGLVVRENLRNLREAPSAGPPTLHLNRDGFAGVFFHPQVNATSVPGAPNIQLNMYEVGQNGALRSGRMTYDGAFQERGRHFMYTAAVYPYGRSEVPVHTVVRFSEGTPAEARSKLITSLVSQRDQHPQNFVFLNRRLYVHESRQLAAIHNAVGAYFDGRARGSLSDYEREMRDFFFVEIPPNADPDLLYDGPQASLPAPGTQLVPARTFADVARRSVFLYQTIDGTFEVVRISRDLEEGYRLISIDESFVETISIDALFSSRRLFLPR